MTSAPSNPRRKSGFTLLELVLAIGLLAMLVGMVFGTARTSLALGNTVVQTQNEEMLQQAFMELLKQRFSSLPGNTRFDLKVEDAGTHYLSDLTLQNVPLSFTWGGQERVAKAVQLSTVKRRSGFLDIVLRYYEYEILEGSESVGGGVSMLDTAPFAEVVLLEDVAYFEWRVLDGRSMEWGYDWELQGRLPLQMELKMKVGMHGEDITHIFWVPPRQNPEILMRQVMQQQGQDEGLGGAPPPPGGEGAPDPGNGRPGGGRPGSGPGRPGGGAGGRPGPPGGVQIPIPPSP
jgi:prepilin-type N-terminal cleavage/methylation domain-containing protein